MYEVIDILFSAVVKIFAGCCLIYYLDSFIERKKGFWITGKAAITAVYFGADVLLGRLFISGSESIITLGRMFGMFMIVLLIAGVFYQADYQMVLFLSVTFIAIKDICTFLTLLVTVWGGKTFELWVLLIEKGYITSQDAFLNLVEGTASLLQILMGVVFSVLFWRSLTLIIKNYKEKDYRINREELLLILTPGLAGFLLCVLLRTIFITINDNVPQTLYQKYPLLMAVIPVILLLSLLSIVYGVKLFQDLITLNREKSNRIILEKQVLNLQEHIGEIEHIYSGVRSMKHDMKNTLSVIMQLALDEENKSGRDLQIYLSELNQTMDRLEFQYKTGNSVVDILLNMKYHEIIRTMPDLQLNADRLVFPDSLQIQSYDIGIILGNALDNAIEACRKLKEKEPDAETFIRLSSFQKGRMFFIEAENSFDGKILRKKHSEFPITDKADKKSHGIGLINIKNTALKYHGGVDWTVENRKFILTVMMQNL